MKIEIQSKKELLFNLTNMRKGIIIVEIDIYQRSKNGWFIRIKDTCKYFVKEKIKVQEDENNPFSPMIEKEIEVEKQDFIYREKNYPENFLNELATALKYKIEDPTKFTESLDYAFQIGLLALTQKECMEAKEKGNYGIYLSEATDWEIFKENESN